ncbi:MAG: hypothetical protein ACLFVU_10155 [Phycisphaerae bacterium]
MKYNMLKTLVLGVVLVATAAAVAEDTVPVRYYLVLDKPMFGGDEQTDSNYRELVLDLEREGDQWGPVYGISRNYNMATHSGAVEKSSVTDKKVSIRLMMDITPDKWIKGGRGEYEIEMTKNGPVLAGTFEGTFKGKKVKGKAWGWAFESKPVSEDFQPLKPQEHPRILFRKSDLPDLRKKAKTPLGQAAMKKMENSLVGLGVLYQLTGDKKWADKALDEAKRVLKGKSYGWYGTAAFTPKRPLGGRMEQLAIGYDLCYDAWPEDFKANIRSWLMDMCFSVFFAPESLGSTNWNVQSNHVGIVYAALGMAGLAMFDEPSPEPTRPSEPFTDLEIPAARDFKPAKGVPVVEMAPGKSPTDWLVTEPLHAVTADDPRAQFYGLEDIHPKPGTKVQVGEYELTFQPIKEENKSTKPFGGVYIGKWLESGKRSKKPLTLVFYTVLDVKKPGLYKVFNPSSRGNLSQMALNGELLAPGQVVKLEKGLYPLMSMIQFRIKWDEAAPHLQEAGEKDIAAFKPTLEEMQKKFQARLLNYRAEHKLWKQYGGANPAYQRLFRLGRWYMFLMCRYAVGTGGYQAEVSHYNYDTTDGLARYAPAFRRMFGYQLSPFKDITYYVPRKIVAGPQDINGTTKIGYPYFAGLFPIVPDRWQGEVLTAWNRSGGVTKPSEAGKLLDRDGVQGFLNYPLEMKPEPLGKDLPNTWIASDFGFYAGRNGWDGDAFITKAFCKSMPIHGWNGPNAGTFRLRGLGQDWAVGSTGRNRKRFQENVVWLPKDEINESGLAEASYFKTEDDGSFVLSIDMNEVYGSAKSVSYSKYGKVQLPGKNKDAKPTGISGMRAIGVDYSGKSGAPCLLVVVDKISGGGKKLWLWQTPGLPEETVKAADNGFTMTGKDDATLRGRFITPEKISVKAKSRTEMFTKAAGHGAGEKKFKVDINAVTVEGGDNWFFVATVGKGEHPPIKVKGSGLDAVVTVGKQTVRFDGKKLIFGK